MKNIISRRKILALPLAMPFIGRNPAEAAQTPVLVELFTSQGCSSCPAADKVAGTLARRNDVIVASLNVDYWDYLGWRDTLARPEYTERQRAYAQGRGDGQVYTPQMVMNGDMHAVGSQTLSVDHAIEKTKYLSTRVPITLGVNKSEVKVSLPSGKIDGEATVWLMGLAPAVKVKIQRGENAGLDNTYHNVVTHLSAAGMWKGEATTLVLPSKPIMAKAEIFVAVLQKGLVGEVLGVSRISA
jgi:hypothetical protein